MIFSENFDVNHCDVNMFCFDEKVTILFPVEIFNQQQTLLHHHLLKVVVANYVVDLAVTTKSSLIPISFINQEVVIVKNIIIL